MPNPLAATPDYASNPLSAGTGPAPSITAAQPPTQAAAYSFNANAAQAWLNHQRTMAVHLGLADPETGLPTKAGLIDAARQVGQSLLLGSISPRVFHGTAQPGMMFDPDRPAFFTTDPARASFYAETGAPKFVGDPAQPNVVPAYLDMKNPKVIENLEPGEHHAAFRAARDAGHDGVILKTKGVPDTYVSFNPSQILPGYGTPPGLTDALPPE